MANSVDPDQLASSEANWSRSTLFAKQGISGFSRTRVNLHMLEETFWLAVAHSIYLVYHSYPKYLDTSTPYHSCSKSWKSTIYNPMSKNCWMSGKQCRPWWDAAFCILLLHMVNTVIHFRLNTLHVESVQFQFQVFQAMWFRFLEKNG